MFLQDVPPGPDYHIIYDNKLVVEKKIPMSMRRYPNVLGCYSLENVTSLECVGCPPLLRHPLLQTHTCIETISPFKFYYGTMVFQDVHDCSELC